MTRADAEPLLEALSRGAAHGVVVLGDVMLDRHLWGHVERISPEAPVPIVRLGHEREVPGGAANVAVNLRHLGANVMLVGVTGDDAEADRLEGALAQEGITARLHRTAGWPTTTKTRVIGERQQLVRIDREAPLVLAAQAQRALANDVRAALSGGASALVLSDYAKGVLDEALCRTVIAEAKQAGARVLVDPKGDAWSKYRGATGISPNLRELRAATGVVRGSVDDLLAGGARLRSELDFEFLALTRGKDGISIVDAEGVGHAHSVAREVYDVTGAGDTVLAVLALGLLGGLSPRQAARLANVAAGIVVGKVGTAAVDRASVVAALSAPGGEGAPASPRILERTDAIAAVARWREQKQRIVFTNGCFDVLHAGHVDCLQKARALGDRLVVAINSDASVRRLKGKDRPLATEQHRALVLAGLACVDLVVVFGEDTPLSLIEAMRPDVLAKGDDYAPEAIVGAAEVTSWGGRVVAIERVPDLSSTTLIEAARSGVRSR